MPRAPCRTLTRLLAVVCVACTSDSSGPRSRLGPGPHFSVSPLPVNLIARITPIGFNNKPFPTPHTYWLTCDDFFVLKSTRPCIRERRTLLAPMDAVVRDLDPSADGFVRFAVVQPDGSPGLTFHFGHVTPATGLSRGTRVTAGQVVATMFYSEGVDFGLINNDVQHNWISPARYIEEYLHEQHTIEQYPEPLRSQLLERVTSRSATPLGRLSYDVAGTASGAWFREGAPSNVFNFGNERYLLWLARYVERDETRIISVGEQWPGMGSLVLAVDPSAPSWEAITPASGIVAIKLWLLTAEALPNTSTAAAQGTLLVQLIDASRLRIDWFNTHGAVSGFTSGSRVYVR